MPFEIFFNELSLTPPAPDMAAGRQNIANFITALRHARKTLGTTLPLRVPREFLNNLRLAPNYMLGQWFNDNAIDRDLRTYFRDAVTRWHLIPKDVHRAQTEANCEVFCQGTVAYELAAAHLNSGIAMSFASAPAWDHATVELDVRTLNSDCEIVTKKMNQPHFSNNEHFDQNLNWVRQQLAISIDSAIDIWEKRAEKFPILDFCENVHNQLQNFNGSASHLLQIVKRLAELDAWRGEHASTHWDEAREQAPCKISPESTATLGRFGAERTFACPHGQSRTFSWHARFTPGAGRIYFHWELKGKLLIGHVGEHLPTVSDPN